MFFIPFVTRLKRPQKFLLPSNPEFIGYMLYTSPSFPTIFISLHKMTRWWQNYLGLHGENVVWAYWLLALHISQLIYLQMPRVIHCLEIFSVCAIKTSVLYVPTKFLFSKHPPNGSVLRVPVPTNVICTNVLKKELNLLMIHFIVCLFQSVLSVLPQN